MTEKGLAQPRIPAATYRFQFNRNFTFEDARKIIPYLYDLGISDVYASPYFTAGKGSQHGYDIVDPNRINPEIGTEEEHDAFAADLRNRGMGLLLDIVPNHMLVDSNTNAWWRDVLENGPSSLYSGVFDINWRPLKRELRDKVLIPVLGDQYGNVLDRQELQLEMHDGAFSVVYYERAFPAVPDSYTCVLSHRLDALQEELREDDPDLVELLSIITAIHHLPPYTERDPEKVTERSREKEVIKKRLKILYENSKPVMNFIDKNISIFNGVQGVRRSFDLLDELLGKQAYRLSYWRVATEEINYRRFFDIDSLGAIRMEDPRVFDRSNNLLLKLVAEEKVTGLRIDHADGLYNPCEYLERLQRECFTRLSPAAADWSYETAPEEEAPVRESKRSDKYDQLRKTVPGYKPFFIVSEKILLKGERIPEDWQVFGTTGYDYMNQVNGIFVDTRNAKAFDSIYRKFTNSGMNFANIVYEKKKLVMQVSMSGEINMLGFRLNNLSEKERHTRDFTLRSLINAITEVIAFYPVYRSYVHDWTVKEQDLQYIESTIAKAKRQNPATSASIFDFLRDVLLLKFPETFTERDKEDWLDFVMKFQQLTGPVTAKGVEDTAFYVYNRLVSLNEVGGSPDRFGISIEAFHGQNLERVRLCPHALLATSTHDTKRSEDVRARISVLSEIPEPWRKGLTRWRQINRGKRRAVEGRIAPSANEEYFLYQHLIGAWPMEKMGEAEHAAFTGRIRDYMLKAVREAKVTSSWVNPDPLYEEALVSFIEEVLEFSPTNRFIQEFAPLQEKVSHYGMLNSLSQTVLKMTCPGVPDFYQGTELWDFSLVDPDNRRPVDYAVRMRILDEIRSRIADIGRIGLLRELLRQKEDGRIKFFITRETLLFRREHKALFDSGQYLPLQTAGRLADNICAFARKHDTGSIVVAVPRLLTRVVSSPELPLGEKVWNDTCVVLPCSGEGGVFRNIFTGEKIAPTSTNEKALLRAAAVFGECPVAVLEVCHNNRH
jgi:(1->4)-alpha-D-glucan 1-alpha-D-glucosylmutase